MWFGQLLRAVEQPFVGFLLAFGLSLFLVTRIVLRSPFADRREASGRSIDKLSGVLGTALLCLLATDALNVVDRRVNSELAFVSKAAVIGAVVTGSLISWRFAARGPKQAVAGSSPQPERRALAASVLLLSVGTAAWFGGRFYFTAFPTLAVVDDSETQGGLIESKDYVAWTDRGREIRLFHLDGEPDGPEAKGTSRQSSIDDYPQMAILRQSRNVGSNCHGWVFCDGRFVLRGDGIEQIIEDNGYAAVEKPRAGDLILYRDPNGQIGHSGLIRGVLDDGTVMVESKWGVDRRYLHAACDQPYSQLFTYYRSPRHGHRLTITKTLPDDLRLSPDDKRALHSVVGVPTESPKNSAGKTRRDSLTSIPRGR
jgi:hypothetical protein